MRCLCMPAGCKSGHCLPLLGPAACLLALWITSSHSRGHCFPGHHFLCAGLPRATMAELVATIKPTDLKGMPAITAAALLVLAAGAGLQPEATVVQACCTALKRHLRQLRCAEGVVVVAVF